MLGAQLQAGGSQFIRNAPGLARVLMGIPGDGDIVMRTLLLVLLILLIIGALPAWPYSNSWGLYPSGGLVLVLVVVLVLTMSRRG